MAYQIGEWQVDPDSSCLIKADEEVRLTPQMMDVLIYLAERPNKVVSIEEMLETLWPDTITGNYAVHNAISNLRHAFHDDTKHPAYIATVPKKGYRLIAAVQKLPLNQDTNLLSERPITPRGAASDYAVHKSIAELRQTLGDDAHNPILSTIARRGYCMIDEVTASKTVGESQKGDALDADTLAAATEPERRIQKNWLLPAVAGTIALFLLLGFWLLAPDEQAGGDLPVLRFTNLDGDPENELFIEGMTESILNGLSGDDLKITSKMNAFAISKENRSIAAIGDALAVRHLLEGSIQRTGESIRVTAQLIRVKDGIHLYSDQFDSPTTNILQVQDQVASRIVRALKIYLDEYKLSRLVYWGAQNVDAYILTADASELARHGNQKALRQALEMYEISIELDPGYVHSYEWAGLAASSLRDFVGPEEAQVLTERMREMLREVVRLGGYTDSLDTLLTWQRHPSLVPFELQARNNLRNCQDKPCGNETYGNILFGARLYNEASQHYEAHLRVGPPWDIPIIRIAMANIILIREGPEAAVAARIHSLRDYPDHIPLLTFIVRDLAIIREFSQAERYLNHMISVDEVGIWANAAGLYFRAIKGDLPLGSEALQDAIQNPLTNYFAAGATYFILGDVASGIRYWQHPQFEWYTAAYYAPLSEVAFAPNVVEDPRYQSLLEELGLGKAWQNFLKEKITEMVPFTGIELSDEN